MGSVEAVGALLAGTADWDAYKKAQGPFEIDLTLGDFRGSDLQGREISSCDLTGSDFTGANLDGAKISASKINGVSFDSASFVGCAFSGVEGTGPSFGSCIFRDAVVTSARLAEADFTRSRFMNLTISSSQFLRSILDHAELRDLTLTGTKLSALRGSESRLVRCRLDDCDILACEFEQGCFTENEFNACAMRDVSYKSGAFTDCGIIRCDLRNVDFGTTHVERCDFSGSKLTDIDLRAIDLASASLLKTAFVGCAWPEMKGSVTLTGGYRPSPHLPRQPVQDTDGVPPLLRREIADAQFIVAFLATVKGPLRRLLVRAWGFTSGYGQELTRLMAVTAMIIALHALIYLAFRGQLFGWHLPDFRLLASALGDFALASLGITPASQLPGAGAVLITSIRIFGFAIFGIWISIAAIKVSKLGSQ